MNSRMMASRSNVGAATCKWPSIKSCAEPVNDGPGQGDARVNEAARKSVGFTPYCADLASEDVQSALTRHNE